MSSQRGKVLVIGFDALDYELFARHNPMGMQLSPLLAPIPVTGPSWTSMYTGDSVARHGVWNVFGLEFRKRYARSDRTNLLLWHLHNVWRVVTFKWPHKRYATYATTPSKYVWDTLGQAGVTFKIVNMPITCPVREVNGVHLGGFPLITRKRWYFPDSIADQIPADYMQMSDLIQWVAEPEWHSNRRWKRRLEEMGFDTVIRRAEKEAHQMIDLFLKLPAADVEMVQFSFVDRIAHLFSMSGQVEQVCYKLVNTLVSELIERARPESVMIVSDHGAQGKGHTDYGCLALEGQLAETVGIPDGYTASVLDVAPTLAAFLGATHTCEGNDLTVTGDYETRNSQQEQEEKEKMIQHLKDIGYL